MHVKADAQAGETGVSLEPVLKNQVESGVLVVVEQHEGVTDEGVKETVVEGSHLRTLCTTLVTEL